MARERGMSGIYQACVVGMERQVESRLWEEEKKRRAILSASHSTTLSTVWYAQCNRSFRRVGDMRRHKCDSVRSRGRREPLRGVLTSTADKNTSALNARECLEEQEI